MIQLDLQSAGSSPNLTYTKLSAFDAITGLLFDLGACWDKGLDLNLDQGLTIRFYVSPSPLDLGFWVRDWELGLDNTISLFFTFCNNI